MFTLTEPSDPLADEAMGSLELEAVELPLIGCIVSGVREVDSRVGSRPTLTVRRGWWREACPGDSCWVAAGELALTVAYLDTAAAPQDNVPLP